MLQLYFTLGSPPSRAVLQTIRMLGLDVEVKNLSLLKGEHLTPEFLKLNPMHQVPVLVDGDLILTESRAIMAYLANSRKPGSSLYPTDPKKRVLVDQMLFFDCVNLFELGAGIMRPVLFTGATNVPADKCSKLKENMQHLERFLEGKKFFTGNDPTLADISIFSTLQLMKAVFTNFGETPVLDSWYERFQSVPGSEENFAGFKAIKDIMAAKGMAMISLSSSGK